MTFPRIATGSIVRVTSSGSRATNGEPLQIPAIVLGQYPEDGQVRLFCFHFEGQYLQNAPADQVEVVLDADHARLALDKLTRERDSDYATRDELGQLRGEVDRAVNLCSRLLAQSGEYALKAEVESLRTGLESNTAVCSRLLALVAEQRETSRKHAGKAVADA